MHFCRSLRFNYSYGGLWSPSHRSNTALSSGGVATMNDNVAVNSGGVSQGGTYALRFSQLEPGAHFILFPSGDENDPLLTKTDEGRASFHTNGKVKKVAPLAFVLRRNPA